MNVLGLDLSNTHAGVCLPDGATERIAVPSPKHLSGHDLWLHRARALSRELADWLLPADLVVIEAPFLHPGHPSSAAPAYYSHAIIGLLLDGTPTVRVAPSVLKKWATGRGNASKVDMMYGVGARTGWKIGGSDDEADAWWLWTIGKALHAASVVELTDWRLELLGHIYKEAAAA